MSAEFAEHISLLAAPIYAALIACTYEKTDCPPDHLEKLRQQAIVQANALWVQTRGKP